MGESIEDKARRTLSLVKRLRERNEHEAADRIEELEKLYSVVTRLYVHLRCERSIAIALEDLNAELEKRGEDRE
jgi:hypothetical protein